MQPFFSIVIPVYNVEPYIARCLDSCINQTFRDIEIIIVDDCGSDNSIKIAEEYAKKDSRITIIHNPRNLGLFHTRSTGVHHAKGQYILFVDSDDFIALNTCEILYSHIFSKNADMLHYRLLHFPRFSKGISPSIYNKKNGAQQEILHFFRNTKSLQSLCDKAIKTKILLQAYSDLSHITTPLNMMEDGIIVLIASFHIHSYIGINQKLYFYRNNPMSLTRSISQEKLKDKFRSYNNLFLALEHLQSLYPLYQRDILVFKNKVYAALVLEARFFNTQTLSNILDYLPQQRYIPSKNLPIFIQSCLISYHFFRRWQTLARICIYLITFGKIKL